MTPTDTITKFLEEIKAHATCTDMQNSPCPVCKYNGPGYYQPNIHPCAEIYNQDSHNDECCRDAIPKALKIIEIMLNTLHAHSDSECDCMSFEGSFLEKEIAKIIEGEA